MRWTAAFIPTLRDDPADAEAISHKLLVRGGFIRQLAMGTYSLLPLGQRVARKVEAIVRSEMERIGGQEFTLPALHPAELWQQSGRWDTVGAVMFRFEDRHGADVCLGITHEEVFTTLAKELRSHRQLPQIWFQFQMKFRDEERPKSGLLRVREFLMKDSYSFDKDAAGLDKAFQNHFDAYRQIYERCGIETLAVQASSGPMGGSESVEFMVETDAGEDWIVACDKCGYAANVEKATSSLPEIADPASEAATEKFPTPGVRTIEDLARMPDGVPPERQIKTLVYVLDGATTLVLLRGDHELVLQKLIDGTDARELRPAHAGEIQEALGASAGSLGAVSISGLRVIADAALRGRRNMTTGANVDGFHLRGVDVARDVSVTQWLDLRLVTAGEACPMCASTLDVRKALEVGHIFKLGTKYSEIFGASVQREDGKNVPLVMGSYGIGIGRLIAAIVERRHDRNGAKWPMSVAPYEVAVTVVNAKDVPTQQAGQQLYDALMQLGVDTILDDRDERPGVKFKDAELIGIPLRVTIGPKGLASGKLEVFFRDSGEKREVDLSKAADFVSEAVFERRR